MIVPSNVAQEQVEQGLSGLRTVCRIAEETAGVISDYQREAPRADRTAVSAPYFRL